MYPWSRVADLLKEVYVY